MNMVLAALCSSAIYYFLSNRKKSATRSGAVKLEMFARSGIVVNHRFEINGNIIVNLQGGR